MKKLTPHFSLNEFFPNCSLDEKSLALDDYIILCNIFALSNLMQSIRDFCKAPVIITSCYRDYEHNKRVGGVRNSQHLTGSACDFKTYAPERIHQLVPWIRDNIEFGQLIEYDNFLHISLPNAGKVCEYIDKRTQSHRNP